MCFHKPAPLANEMACSALQTFVKQYIHQYTLGSTSYAVEDMLEDRCWVQGIIPRRRPDFINATVEDNFFEDFYLLKPHNYSIWEMKPHPKIIFPNIGRKDLWNKQENISLSCPSSRNWNMHWYFAIFSWSSFWRNDAPNSRNRAAV